MLLFTSVINANAIVARAPARIRTLFVFRHGDLPSVFAEFERAMIQERVRAGLRRAVSEGKIGGCAPRYRLLAAHFEAMAQEYERLATEKPPAPEPVERPTRDIQEAPDLLTWAELKGRGWPYLRTGGD
jgi:hypothetical protein